MSLLSFEVEVYSINIIEEENNVFVFVFIVSLADTSVVIEEKDEEKKIKIDIELIRYTNFSIERFNIKLI